MTRDERRIVVASSLGTLFEWYDFFLYGALSAITSRHFFANVAEGPAFIFALLTFSAGFAVRPFGAVAFGRLGDRAGRKRTFLVTIVIMGASTVLVGALPSYASIGMGAPILLVGLRLLQGLALGGEYGGAAIYVAEHAPPGQRGRYTSWIQAMASLGLFLSLGVIASVRSIVGEVAFAAWGWRLPFLLSAVLLGVSIWVRVTLDESPVFRRMQAEGRLSKAPLREALGQWRYVKLGLVAMFGILAGQATLWYTGQFYSLFFLTQTLKVDGLTANLLVGVAIAAAAPFYVVFGALSDRIGRKPLIVGGCVLAALVYFPIFHGLMRYGNPALDRARGDAPVALVADRERCSVHLSPLGGATTTSSCDVAKAALATSGVDYDLVDAPRGSVARVRVRDVEVEAFEPGGDVTAQAAALSGRLEAALRASGYPAAADPSAIGRTKIVLLLFVLGVLSAMTYAPVAATMVELFPARIRYTAMSVPYHAANGWIGGLLPPAAFTLVGATGSVYAGLLYPLFFAIVTVVVGALFLPETRGTSIDESDR